MQETKEMQVQSVGLEYPLEEDMAVYSSTLAWRISWAEEPGGLQSMGSQRVGHWATKPLNSEAGLAGWSTLELGSFW